MSRSAVRRSAPFRRLPDLRRSRVVASAESAIEVGEIAESDIEGQRADATIGKARIAQHPVHARKPAAADKGREGEPLALEEFVDVSRRYPLAPRDGSDRQIAITEGSP